MGGRNYRDLIVWQKAMDLTAAVYQLSSQFPADERFGLVSQIRRAAVSIPSNIAEGEGRGSAKEFVHFLCIAYASLREVETQILLSVRLEFVADGQVDLILELCAEVGRLINGLVRAKST